MYRVRWRRVALVLFVIILPLILGWLGENLSFGNFSDVPILGAATHHNREAKALVLLGLLLLSAVLLVQFVVRR